MGRSFHLSSSVVNAPLPAASIGGKEDEPCFALLIETCKLLRTAVDTLVRHLSGIS